jgi:hypothetical protein
LGVACARIARRSSWTIVLAEIFDMPESRAFPYPSSHQPTNEPTEHSSRSTAALGSAALHVFLLSLYGLPFLSFLSRFFAPFPPPFVIPAHLWPLCFLPMQLPYKHQGCVPPTRYALCACRTSNHGDRQSVQHERLVGRRSMKRNKREKP